MYITEGSIEMSFTYSYAVTLPERRTIKLPEVLAHAGTAPVGAKVDVIYGRNNQAVVVVPHGAKLGKWQAERIQKLTDEAIDS